MSLPIIVISFLSYGITIGATTPSYVTTTCPHNNFESFDPNSTYQKNLQILLSNLTSMATIPSGFYSSTAGDESSTDRVYGLFLCRGDVPPDFCRDCVSTAAKLNFSTTSQCRSKEAVTWYEECMVRYSDQDIFSVLENDDPIAIYNPNNTVQAATLLMQKLNSTMTEIANKAASSLSGKKFATKQVSFEPGNPLYCLVQCTPDLSVGDCNSCLQSEIVNLPNGTAGAKMLRESCNLRYELFPFYENTVSSSTPNPKVNSATSGGHSKEIIIIVAVVVCSVAVALFAIVSVFKLRRKKKEQHSGEVESVGYDFATYESVQYDLVPLEAATNGFSDENKIGEGGFGAVYKGVLADGKEIAIKRLFKGLGQSGNEFKNEVEVVTRLQHRNLVRLLGFCFDGDEKILVYEFVPNKSLDYILFDPQKKKHLNWSKRYNIIEGIARGLLYLHEDSRHRIIHRDLKASNILLDTNMNAKISDFGTARIFGANQTHDSTNRVAGTFGYIAPEYIFHGQYSDKSDVYSFGVLVLEIISGVRKTSFQQSDIDHDLLSYAWKNWRDQSPLKLIDPGLQYSYSNDEVIRCIHLGLLCVQENPELRPNMRSVVLMLYMCSVTNLPVPQQPPFSMLSMTEESHTDEKGMQLATRSMPWSLNKDSVTELDPR